MAADLFETYVVTILAQRMVLLALLMPADMAPATLLNLMSLPPLVVENLFAS
jgi:Na+/H+-translocating membrane pyrophosphatase